MQLRELIAATAAYPALGGVQTAGDLGIEVESVAYDSRRVGTGALYCCVPGLEVDGHQFAAEAVAAGAAALLCERPVGAGVPEVRVPSVRAAMGPLAAVMAGEPSQRLDLVGFTGTNGKTTGTHLLVSILTTAGWPSAAIGTLTGARTTPEAPDLQFALAQYLSEGIRAVAMEVSSHALAQHRVDGCRFRVAVFTNLSRDHLDYHGDINAYFRTKARLFEPSLSDRAVVDLDDSHGRLLFDAATIPTVGYSLTDAGDIEVSRHGSRFTWRGHAVNLALTGRFNVSNALAAATAAAELGIETATIAAGLDSSGPVPGRFEQVPTDQPFSVVVDYAHTPDGLAHALEAARELAGGHRVMLVFGCGGDRDRSKRPEMGRIAADRADVAVLTSDNPRSEDPLAIIEQVAAGVVDRSCLTVVPDRAEAIAVAIGRAGRGDVVLLAGKGHETTQVIGDRVLDFDDRAVAAQALAARGGGLEDAHA